MCNHLLLQVYQIGGPHEAKKIPNHMKFILGGLAGMAGIIFVQPLDLLKSRLQLMKADSKGNKQSALQVFSTVVKNEGLTGLYTGLSAALLRQATYTTTRLGIYTWVLEAITVDEKPTPFLTKATLGMFSGVCGSFIGTPSDVALIRMTVDGRLPENQRRNYTGVFNALARIYKEEGLTTLWRGATPTMYRAMVVNAAELGSYTQAKEYLLYNGYFTEGITLHFIASLISGIITSVTSLPVDIAKTKMQDMRIINGKPEFSGPLDVITKLIKHEGVASLWKGLSPYILRMGPHTVLTFVFLEQFNAAYIKYVLR